MGLFHTGAQARDEGEVFVAMKTAQMLAGRPNVINDIRLRLDDPGQARAVATRAEAQLGYKAMSWQEANESIMEVLIIRNVIMYTVVAAILLVAGFGIFNIVSTITHEKARDIAILKSLGFREADMRRLFLVEGLAIGVAGSILGWGVGFGSLAAARQRALRIQRADGRGLRAAACLERLALCDCGGLRSARCGRRGLPAGPPGCPPEPRGHHPGRHVTALIEAEALTRTLPAVVPVTLVRDVTLTIGAAEFVAITGPSGSGKSSLLYLLGLLDRPTSGTLRIAGHDTAAMSEAERSDMRLASIGFVFQFHFLLPEFSVRQNVEIPMRKLGRLPRQMIRTRAGEILGAPRARGPSGQAPGSALRRPAPEGRGRARARQRPAARACR